HRHRPRRLRAGRRAVARGPLYDRWLAGRSARPRCGRPPDPRGGGARGARGRRRARPRPRAGHRPPRRQARQRLAGRGGGGGAGTVSIEGEAGIGKTTLLDALAAEARLAGGTVVWGRAEPEGVAYGPWRPVVRALAGAVAPDDVPPAVERLRGGGGPADGAG